MSNAESLERLARVGDITVGVISRRHHRPKERAGSGATAGSFANFNCRALRAMGGPRYSATSTTVYMPR